MSIQSIRPVGPNHIPTGAHVEKEKTAPKSATLSAASLPGYGAPSHVKLARLRRGRISSGTPLGKIERELCQLLKAETWLLTAELAILLRDFHLSSQPHWIELRPELLAAGISVIGFPERRGVALIEHTQELKDYGPMRVLFYALERAEKRLDHSIVGRLHRLKEKMEREFRNLSEVPNEHRRHLRTEKNYPWRGPYRRDLLRTT
jgi:hypothetical protein